MEEVWASIDDLKENEKAYNAIKAQKQSEADGLKKRTWGIEKEVERGVQTHY